MNWYKFLTETNKIHNDERPPDRLPIGVYHEECKINLTENDSRKMFS
jgi:hypothetical protein